MIQVQIDWADAFLGYVPSKYIFAQGGIYTCESETTVIFLYLLTLSLSRWDLGRNGHAA